MRVLNFYSSVFADQLRRGRKTATIRLGDKSGKYKKGMIVQVLAGARFSSREKVFSAVIDKVATAFRGHAMELVRSDLSVPQQDQIRAAFRGTPGGWHGRLARTAPRCGRSYRTGNCGQAGFWPGSQRGSRGQYRIPRKRICTGAGS